MAIARSKITSQGQISVPASVRNKLGVGPGSTLEWDEEDSKIVVRRAGGYSFVDIHNAIFGGKRPKKASLRQLRESIGRSVRERYVRRQS